jgi:uncharacterized protein
MKGIVTLTFVFFVALGSRVCAQESSSPDGFNTYYYPNGKVLSEGFLKEGKPEGYWKTYYTTGVLKSEGNRKNFMLDSIWIFYNSTGDTINKINYLLGKKNGYYYEYFSDRSKPEYVGKVMSKELYVNDKKEGLSWYYYEGGQVHETINYLNDQMEGESVEFDKSGLIITLKRYRKGLLVERQKINRKDENGEKSGEWIEFYSGTKIKSVSNYKEGLLDGYYKQYDELGLLKLTLLYSEGKLVQKVDESSAEIVIIDKHDSAGNIIESGPYINNVPVNIHKSFNKDGNVTASIIYDNFGVVQSRGIIDKEGKRQGDWIDFLPNGVKHAVGSYNNSLREGKWTFYFSDGKVEQVGNYKNGKENGEWFRYYNSGKLYIEENFYSGKEDGSYTEYDSIGNVIKQGEYLDGQEEGQWVEHINDFSVTGSYVAGLQDGRWKYYYNDGKVMFEGIYVQGNPDGKFKFYYPDGALKEEQYYSNGIPDKLWKKYDEEGNVIIAVTYSNGKEYRINGVRVDFPEDNKVVIK